MSKYSLGLCELHCAVIHGDEDLPHYLVIDTFKELILDEEEDEDEEKESENIGQIMEMCRESYEELTFTTNPHSIVRNYLTMIEMDDYIKPEIMECIQLDSGHLVAILKTFWIRIIQRTWKKVFKQRQEMIQRWKHPDHLNYVRLHGRTQNYMPSLVGMLL